MIRGSASALALLCVVALGVPALVALPARPARAVAQVTDDGRIRLYYKSSALRQVVEEVGKALGERVVLDPGMGGRFTITIDRPVTPEEAIEILEAALIMQGYALVRSFDGTLKVLEVRDAADGSHWTGPVALEEDRNKLVTTMLSLETADAEQVATRMKHLVSDQDSLVAYPPSNSLIMTGTERRVRRMIQLARALDAGGQNDLWVRTLRYRGALEVSEMLRELLAPGDAAGAPPSSEPEPHIWADERINTIVIVGSEDQLDRARDFLAEIDLPLGADTKIHVVPIFNRDVEKLQNLLVQMAAGRVIGSQAAGETVMGKNFFAIADENTNSLIVDADPDTFKVLMRTIAELDRPQPRIQVDVTAWEIRNPSSLSLGVDWFLPVIEPNSDGTGSAMTILSNPSGGGLRSDFGEGINFFGRLSRDPLLIPFTDPQGNVQQIEVPRETVVVTAASNQVKIRSLMRPSLVMISGEEQRIFAGQNVPILVGASAEELSGTQTNVQVQRQDVGVELRATARAGQRGDVELDLFIELSRVSPSAVGNTQQVGPTLDSRKIETKVRLSDGQLAVIGLSEGADRDRSKNSTPFLSDIPILGHAFETRSTSSEQTHLVFAVQARLLDSPADDLAESLRQRLALERSLSRVRGLRRSPNAPYAVLVTTRDAQEEAESLAEGFLREGLQAQVGRWSLDGSERFDVYLTGYRELAVAGFDSLRLREKGFDPEVVVLPGEVTVARMPGLETLGAAP